MDNNKVMQPDYGTGQKKLNIYIAGLFICSILTVLSFWIVMADQFNKLTTFIIIYSAAFIQFFVQLICFLRLNIQTEQARTNVMSFIFTGVILISIIIGSLWIMSNLQYNMMH